MVLIAADGGAFTTMPRGMGSTRVWMIRCLTAQLALGYGCACGCRRHAERVTEPPPADTAPAAGPTTRPTTHPTTSGTTPIAAAAAAAPHGVDRATRTFVCTPAAVRLNYPPGWEAVASKDFELM